MWGFAKRGTMATLGETLVNRDGFGVAMLAGRELRFSSGSLPHGRGSVRSTVMPTQAWHPARPVLGAWHD